MISWKYIRGAGEVELSREFCVVWRVLFYATICCGICEILGAVLEGGLRVVWWCEYVIFVVADGYGISVAAQVVMCVS